MRHIKSNGKILTVREVGPVQYELEAQGRVPLPILDIIVEDNVARDTLRNIAAIDHGGSYVRIETAKAPPLTDLPLDTPQNTPVQPAKPKRTHK